MATPTKVLVLGSGWVGKRLATYLRSERGCSVIETHRTAVSSSSPGTEVVEFDLAREETWKNLPLTVNKVVITFPLRTEAQSSNTSSLVKFTRTYLQQCGADCIVAYGSTRRYVCPAPHAVMSVAVRCISIRVLVADQPFAFGRRSTRAVSLTTSKSAWLARSGCYRSYRRQC